MKSSAYVPNGDSSLTPDNMMMLRPYFLCRNTLWGLMLYTIILIAPSCSNTQTSFSHQYSSLEEFVTERPVMNTEGK